MRALAALGALAFLALALAPPAAAYTCTQPNPNLRLCDVDDNGTPDVVFVFTNLGTLIVVAYHSDDVTSTGVIYSTTSFGYHGGGVSAGCADFDHNFDCEYASVNYGSTDLGYLAVEKYGSHVQVCRYGGVFGYGCAPLL